MIKNIITTWHKEITDGTIIVEKTKRERNLWELNLAKFTKDSGPGIGDWIVINLNILKQYKITNEEYSRDIL